MSFNIRAARGSAAGHPPPCREAVALRSLRRRYDLSVRDAARVLKCSTRIIGDLELGRIVATNWEEVFAPLALSFPSLCVMCNGMGLVDGELPCPARDIGWHAGAVEDP